MTIDLLTEEPCGFFDSNRISRCIYDPRKNFLKTIWQKAKPVLDSELNEREDIDNFIRRQILVLLAGEITIVEGLHPQQSLTPNKLLLSEGEMVVRGWDIIVEKNEGGFPSVDQNFNVIVNPGPGETKFPLNGLGFSPNLSFDFPVGDNNSTIIASGTEYSSLRRELCVEIENTCATSPITYRIETLDGAYGETAEVPPSGRRIFCLKENLYNCVSLPLAPSAGAGNRCDFVYLQIGEVEICPTTTLVKRNGHISHREDIPANIIDPDLAKETSRRTQVQFDIRACAGGLPEASEGFYIYPLFEVLRTPGKGLIELEDVTRIVPQIDLTKSGLFELVVRGAGITHDSIIDVGDDNTVTPPPSPIVVGSTVHFRNAGPSNQRSFTIDFSPCLPETTCYEKEIRESFILRPKETRCVNFNCAGMYNLVDAETDSIITTIEVVLWGGGGISSTELQSIRCAIGEQYFPSTGPLHPCDDTTTPDPGTEQSLDVRLDSMILDFFELSICLAEAKGSSTINLSYYFVDRFLDLGAVEEPYKSIILANSAFIGGSIVVPP